MSEIEIGGATIRGGKLLLLIPLLGTLGGGLYGAFEEIISLFPGLIIHQEILKIFIFMILIMTPIGQQACSKPNLNF